MQIGLACWRKRAWNWSLIVLNNKMLFHFITPTVPRSEWKSEITSFKVSLRLLLCCCWWCWWWRWRSWRWWWVWSGVAGWLSIVGWWVGEYTVTWNHCVIILVALYSFVKKSYSFILNQMFSKIFKEQKKSLKFCLQTSQQRSPQPWW